MTVTIKQIAEHCGLSVPTVSFVLNNKPYKFRPETRQRVWSSARELGYRPNTSARAMQSGRFGCLALLMSLDGSRTQVSPEMWEGMQSAVNASDLHLTVASLRHERPGRRLPLPKILRQWTADGLLICHARRLPQRVTESIHTHNVPSVWLNTKQATGSVYANLYEAGRWAAEHLLDLGHRQIAYVDYSHEYVSEQDYLGYVSEMQKAGLQPSLIHGMRRLPMAKRVEFSSRWLARPDRPTAVLAHSESEATAVYSAALTLGIKVPQALSIITFSCRRPRDTELQFTTMLLPDALIGQSAVEMLIEKIENPTRKLPSRAVPVGFAEGLTCGPKAK